MNQRATSAEKIAERLRELISTGAIAPGTPLREELLASQFGVSRHIIREVLRVLASEHVAEYSSYKGARVTRLSREDVVDIYRARSFIECQMLAEHGHRVELGPLASIHGEFARAVADEDWHRAFQLDVAFHAAIVGAGGSPRISAWHSDLMHSLKLAHLVAPDFRGRGLVDSVPQHAEIVVALVGGDAAGARDAMARHLASAQHCLLCGLEGPGEAGAGKPLPHAELAP